MAFLETSNSEIEVDVVEQQQHFYELFGHSSSIIYDCYNSKEFLAKKIDLILPQKSETEHNKLTATIWDQSVHNGGKCLYMSPIYVTLVVDYQPSKDFSSTKILSKSIQVHSVFRVRKCMTNPPHSTNCCAVFVDESGRVYKNWSSFREDNVYDDGLVVAPLNGIYNGTPEDAVRLEFFERRAGITRSLDRGSMVVGLASAGIAAVTFIPAITIAPVVAVGAAAAGLSCAMYTGIRGIYNLYDRKKHKQTIKLTDPDARSSWINFAAGAFSFSAASATQLLTTAAHNTRGMSNILRTTAHALNAGALGLHTTGCLEDIYILISKMYGLENMSLIEISHLSTVLFLLTHSVKNQEAAEDLLALSQDNELAVLKKILRQSQKCLIKDLVKATRKVQGCTDETNSNGQVTVRSLKATIDSRPILMELDNEEEEGTDKRNIRKELINSTYLQSFQGQVYSYISILEKFKTRGENELKLCIINLLKEVSLNLFDAFMSLLDDLISKYGTMAESRSQNVITFEHFAVMILKQLNVISKESNITLKQYLIRLNDAECEKIDERIREYFEHLKDEHVQDAGELLASHVDLTDDEKIAMVIDSEVETTVARFVDLKLVLSKKDLIETVKDVMHNMPLSAAHNFFDFVKEFELTIGGQLRSGLGRFIPIDILMIDIHSVFMKLGGNFGEEFTWQSGILNETIVKEICQFYFDQLPRGISNKCKHCDGFYYN